MKKIKINILSFGRFHMLDLARELDKQGFDVRFYSYVSSKRCLKFGLPAECGRSLFWILAPFIFLRRYFSFFTQIHMILQDYIMGIFMRKCDIVISLTGFIFAPKQAQKKGSIIIFERGSKHILEQKKILEQNPLLKNKAAIPKRNISLNLKAYEIADYISIASQHVKNSFLLHNYPIDKLFVNLYGVDLSMFHSIPKSSKEYDIIMVGGWSYQKGCDLIIEALKNSEFTLLHVGAIVDLAFPKLPNFTHIEPVDQTQLIHYYNKAKIFVLPSRQEGFAMVQCQALACNMPIVGSIDSGALDLKQIVRYPEFITIIINYTADAVKEAIQNSMDNYKKQNGCEYAGNAMKNLTWEAYGKRYADFLLEITKKQ